MLLAIDIGNTNIVLGVHDGTNWRYDWRVQTLHDRMPDEYAVLFRTLFEDAELSFADFDKAIISSVVPQLTLNLKEMIETRTQAPVLILGSHLDLGIKIQTDHPDRVGSDLIADAVAAYKHFGENCIVVDFGTATTFTAIAHPGVMLGTAIAAGLNVTMSALVSRTAQLPYIELTPPSSVIGKNTIHSMQAGLLLGYVAMLEGLIDRMRAELGTAKVAATGGLARFIAPLTNHFDVVDPRLTLEGLRLLAERN